MTEKSVIFKIFPSRLTNSPFLTGFFKTWLNAEITPLLNGALHPVLLKLIYLEPFSKIRLEFRARRGSVKKWSIHVVCEHFEPFHNAAMDTKIVFEIGSNLAVDSHSLIRQKKAQNQTHRGLLSCAFQNMFR